MNPYFYLKIKKYKKNNLKKKFNVFIFKEIVFKKDNLKIYKKKQSNKKFKYKPFIFYYNQKMHFKHSALLLKLSLNERKFNLWEKIDNWFHIFIFYNKKRWEDYTVFKNFIESKKYLKVIHYLFYLKKKNIFKKNQKLKIKEQRNIKFWIWIFNINKNFTVYFHNAKSFLYKYINNKNYKFKFFKKNFVRYNLSLVSLKLLSYILEENYKDKVLNSSRSKWNSKFKKLVNINSCIKNNLKKSVYLSYFYFYFGLKWKLMYFSYVIVNDFRTTKILYFWLFRYFIFYIIETFFKKVKVKLNVFYFNIDNLKCLLKTIKFKKLNLKKKKKKKIKKAINFDIIIFIKKSLNIIVLIFNEIIDFLNLFVDKYLYSDFKNTVKKSKDYIYPEFMVVVNYIKNYFKK